LATEHAHDVHELARRFVAQVRELPFQERTFNAIRAASCDLVQAGCPWAQLEAWLTEVRFDVKYRDAMAVIKEVIAVNS
jgi:hypothetical protein